MNRSSLFIVLFLGVCLVPSGGPGCMQEDMSSPFCIVGTFQGCGPGDICVDEANGPACKVRCTDASDCPAHLSACTPIAPGSHLNFCRPPACASDGGCGADAGDDILFDAGP